MRDLFDDFLEELRKREAVARGETSRPGKPDRDAPDDDADAGRDGR